MKSPQIVRILDVAEITKIENAQGVSPRALLVHGKDFRHTEQVLVHGIYAPEFVIVDQYTLLVQVPTALVDATIYDVSVFSSNFSLTERSLLNFGVGARLKSATGILRLVQTFSRLLLRTPGSNIFKKTLGGGILGIIGKNITETTAADISVGVRKVAADIIARQSPVREIPPSERLLSAEVVGFYSDEANTTVYATIVLTTHSNDQAAFTTSPL